MKDAKQPAAQTGRLALIDRLAPLILEERRREAEYYAARHSRERPPWYFLNVSHPTIKRLYLRYIQRAFDGKPLVAPLGDLDRVKFELAMLHPAVLRELAEEYLTTDTTPAPPPTEQPNTK